jgi:hypothetical protein
MIRSPYCFAPRKIGKDTLRIGPVPSLLHLRLPPKGGNGESSGEGELSHTETKKGERIMKRFSLAVLAILFVLCVFRIPSASAALWWVAAYRTDTGGGPFTILFNDSDNDKVVSWDDIEYSHTHFDGFSGVWLTESSNITWYTDIEGIPNLEIPGSGTPPLTLVGTDKFWYFSNDTDDTKRPREFWDYYTATLVPIPSAVLLLGSGLIGFIGLRRRFGRK